VEQTGPGCINSIFKSLFSIQFISSCSFFFVSCVVFFYLFLDSLSLPLSSSLVPMLLVVGVSLNNFIGSDDKGETPLRASHILDHLLPRLRTYSVVKQSRIARTHSFAYFLHYCCCMSGYQKVNCDCLGGCHQRKKYDLKPAVTNKVQDYFWL
jgi:hypothetical protein